MSMFKQAVKREAKLRLAIAGPSGSGKTYTSLAIATALANGAPVALVDTEHGSASKYADLFGFDVAEMHPPFHPDKFVAAINDAAAAGYAVIVLDSLTHAWSGTGGMLDIVDEIAKRKAGGNTFAAWKDGTPIQNKLIDAIVGAPIHVIATMRSKQDFVQDKDDRGKTVVRKVGMAVQQRDGFEYEFDVALDMNVDNEAVVSKTRCPALTGRVFAKPGRDIAAILAEWLHGQPEQPTIIPQEVRPANKPAAPAAATNGNGSQSSVNNGGGGGAAGGTVRPGTLKRLHVVGVEWYGSEWEAKRHELVAAITKGRTESSKELTEAEAAKLVAGIESKIAAEHEAVDAIPPMQDAEPVAV